VRVGGGGGGEWILSVEQSSGGPVPVVEGGLELLLLRGEADGLAVQLSQPRSGLVEDGVGGAGWGFRFGLCKHGYSLSVLCWPALGTAGSLVKDVQKHIGGGRRCVIVVRLRGRDTHP